MNQKGFTIRLTTDQNFRYQQNLQQAGVAVVVMIAPTNRLSELIPLISNVCDVLNTMTSREVIEITNLGLSILIEITRI